MDAATLQARVYSGYAKAAKRIGYVYTQYRATSTANPLAPQNAIINVNAAFTPGARTYSSWFQQASHVKDAYWSALFDPTGSLAGDPVHSYFQVGDYLSNPTHGTYFVIGMMDILPILCVQCTHVLNVVRPAVQAAVGANPYGGTYPGTEQMIMTSWPGSLRAAERGRFNEVRLPTDQPSPLFDVFLPAFPGVSLRSGDFVTDDNVPARRYDIASAELTMYGWRMVTQQAIT